MIIIRRLTHITYLKRGNTMSGLVELVSVHGHRIYLNTDCIRRIEPRNDQPPTTLIVYSYQNGETGFEVPGKLDDIAQAINTQMKF